MPVVTIKFNLPEEREEHDYAMNGATYHCCLWEIANEVFRPARKHGYDDQRINDLITKLDNLAGEDAEGATELISLLEQRFYDILNSSNVSV
jgi:hypothetical protein